jgi:hypothetical protein
MMDEITAEVVGLARFPIVDVVVFLKMALQHQMMKALGEKRMRLR